MNCATMRTQCMTMRWMAMGKYIPRRVFKPRPFKSERALFFLFVFQILKREAVNRAQETVERDKFICSRRRAETRRKTFVFIFKSLFLIVQV